MQRLAALLPGVPGESSAAEGLPPQQVEALAFAWLACRCVRREKLELHKHNGRPGARVLGGFPSLGREAGTAAAGAWWRWGS
jgi:anhydro-N-acetylmuramic acid kinase